MDIRFEWEDDPEIGHYSCDLVEDNKVLEEISFTDYTCDYHQVSDKERRYTRPYAFEVRYCNGFSMHQGFDYDEDYDNHRDENGYRIGGYQGKCTHTVEDIKHWCEQYLASGYIGHYEDILRDIDIIKQRAEYLMARGFTSEEPGKDWRKPNTNV